MRDAYRGFRSFHYCLRTAGAVPVPIPGAIRLTREPDMQEVKIRPDQTGQPAEYTAAFRDRGIKLGLEVVSLPVQFLVDVLGFTVGANGIITEGEHPTVHFALLYETGSLHGAVRHSYLDCVCQKPKFDVTTLSRSSKYDTRRLELVANKDIFSSKAYKRSIREEDDPAVFAAWFEGLQ